MAQWIQRMVSAILLMVFVASIIPLALAERGSEREEQRGLRIQVESSVSADVEDNSTEESQGRVKNARAVLEQERKEAMRDVREQGKELKEEMREARDAGKKFSTRGKAVMKERMENLREKYINLKVEYKQKRQEYQDYRRDLKEKHKDAKECEEDSTECMDKKQELKRGVKQHLLKTVELIDRSLEKLTNRVESSEKLTE